jgi:rhamnose transport system ATP-binding protein
MNTTTSPVVATQGIYMAFGGVDVLKNVDFTLYPGEVLGLMGENGAGKSTLAKILAGVHQPRAGNILVNGKPTVIANPHYATELGIALIHQEPLTFPDLSVAENIFVGRQPTFKKLRLVSWKTIYTWAEELLKALGLPINPKTKIRQLSFADQQMVDIAAALSQNTKVLLMDEPTASLTPNEVERLFVIMRRLRAQGTAIVFINHRLEEVFAIADRIAVMRDGEMIEERIPSATSHAEIIRLMVGRELKTLFERPTAPQVGMPVLEVNGLSRKGKFQDISFHICAGEIVGMSGLVGAGRSDVAQAIFGVVQADTGHIRIEGREATIANPRDAMALGLAYVPEDRQHQGLFMPTSVTRNTGIATLQTFARNGWVSEQAERQATNDYVERLRIALRTIEQPVRELSGGNQQKVVLSRWLLTKPKVIILDEPTRGIDVGAKAEVHRLMGELAAQGLGIFMISSELPEILAMSDRVLVMHEGRLTARLSKQEMSSERIMAAATGQPVSGGKVL